MSRIRIQDIANISHYSVSTVSRALNDNPLISQQVRVEIQGLAQRMGYYDRLHPKSGGVMQKTIGFCINDISNPICSDLINGIYAGSATQNLNILIVDSRSSYECERKNMEYLRSIHVDGIILLPVIMDESAIAAQGTFGIPIVNICNLYTPGSTSFVGIDYTNAAYKATEYIINMGHKKIAFLGKASRFATRQAGIIKACLDNNIPISDDDFYPALPNYESGYFAMERLLLEHKDYTAIITANDYLALGAINCIVHYNRTVPDDFSVVGFDNVAISGHSSINLTTVNQPAQEIGAKSVEILCNKIYNNDTSNQYHVFESSLIIRNSCKPA